MALDVAGFPLPASFIKFTSSFWSAEPTVDGVSGLLRSCMEGVAGKLGLSVALPVAVRVGRNWDELEM